MGDLRFGAERGRAKLFNADFSLRRIPKNVGEETDHSGRYLLDRDNPRLRGGTRLSPLRR